MTNRIRFSCNWNNKLAGGSKAFTTIRLYNPHLYKIGETYEIFLAQGKEEKFLCYADIVDIKEFMLDKLSPYMSYLDTGYSVDECKRMIQTMHKNKVKDWSKQYLSLILLVKLDPRKNATPEKSLLESNY